MPLLFDRLSSRFSHGLLVTIKAKLLELGNAGGAV
jgi:chromosomal replication initiation ATPase DnaA